MTWSGDEGLGEAHLASDRSAPPSIERGDAALAAGDWAAARTAFEGVLSARPSPAAAEDAPPEALDGLGRALWWTGDAEAALQYRQRAYAGFRRRGEVRRAARIALWLAGEYDALHANEAAANGWIARAERLLRAAGPGVEDGWLALARAARTSDPREREAASRLALEVALRDGDPDLELRALAALGSAEIALGLVDEGLTRFDEAMAGGTGGEPRDLATLAELYCALLAACELAGDERRPAQWGRVIEAFVAAHGHLPLLAFCRCCCADVFAANGRPDEAEEQLTRALAELRTAGHQARCVHPAARLAERRIQQGRLDEAEQLLEGHERSPEALQAAVALRLGRGEHEAAVALLERRLDDVGRDTLLAAPLLARLVEASIARGDLVGARTAVEQLQAIAGRSGRARAQAAADLAAGRVARAEGRDAAAASLLDRAVDAFSTTGLPLDAARARLDLALALEPTSAAVAADRAREARADFERLGAHREADAASAVLRRLGVRGRSGPRDHGTLSRRELEVLRLLAEGLSNAAIGARLFISPKTVEHHVGRILAKLELRNRAEAAGYFTRHLAEADGS
jgi:DNA-binding NarL/FixJ family response regulator